MGVKQYGSKCTRDCRHRFATVLRIQKFRQREHSTFPSCLRATRTYPIASRCGVFCKTDIQNLIAKNVSRENIAASIFHSVAIQTVTTLARGYNIKPPILLCGGPLTFIPALRKAFKCYLSLNEADIILPQYGELIAAYGTALVNINNECIEPLSSLISRLQAALARC